MLFFLYFSLIKVFQVWEFLVCLLLREENWKSEQRKSDLCSLADFPALDQCLCFSFSMWWKLFDCLFGMKRANICKDLTSQSHFLTRPPLLISDQKRQLTIPDFSAHGSWLVNPENRSASLVKFLHLLYTKRGKKKQHSIRYTSLTLSREISKQRMVRKRLVWQS